VFWGPKRPHTPEKLSSQKGRDEHRFSGTDPCDIKFTRDLTGTQASITLQATPEVRKFSFMYLGFILLYYCDCKLLLQRGEVPSISILKKKVSKLADVKKININIIRFNEGMLWMRGIITRKVIVPLSLSFPWP
jgi:hypothetical protein